MKINGSYFDPLRPTSASTPAAPRPSSTEITPSSAPAPARSDSVEISSEGRRLQAQQRDEALDPDRVAELRQKVLTGAYNTLDVVDQVARRIVTRGDL